MTQTATPATPGIDLDLGTLARDPVNIKARSGRVFRASADLPVFTTLRLYRLARKAAEAGGDTSDFGIDEVEEILSGAHAIFASVDETVTQEDIERNFTLAQILEIVAFLSSLGEATETPPAEEAVPAPKTAAVSRPKTTTRKPSKSSK